MRTRKVAVLCLVAVLAASSSRAAVMNGWEIGWNDMATMTGGTTTLVTEAGLLQYVNASGVRLNFSNEDFFAGYFGIDNAYSWADAVGDVGQHRFDGVVRNAGYVGSVPLVTAADYNGSTGVPAGNFEWLVNNYSASTVVNSLIRGTDSSAIFLPDEGRFESYLESTGTWHWYTPGTPDSLMSGWIQNGPWDWDIGGDFAEYYGRYMTGRFRIVGDYLAGPGGLPEAFGNVVLQYEVAVVPLPGAAGLGLLGLGLVGYMRRRKSVQA